MTASARGEKALVGVSQCLLGDPVRYDGGHKYDYWVSQVLGEYFEYRPVCPEMAIGLGVPRKPIRLQDIDGLIRVRGVEEPGLDVTDALALEAERTLDAAPTLSGFIFMQNSPSCGLYTVKRFSEQGVLRDHAGRGEFSRRLVEQQPLLPVAEAQELAGTVQRTSFITRVRAYHDWQRCLGNNPTPEALVGFYSRYQTHLKVHHPASAQALDRLLAPDRLLESPDGRKVQTLNLEALAVLMNGLCAQASGALPCN